MGFADAARAKARAQVSEFEAQLTDLRNQLAQAENELNSAQAAGNLWESVEDTPVVGSLTSGLRGKSSVDRAKAQADIDKLKSQISTVEAKLAWARKAESAITTVTEEE